jgi:hypothetical protein
MIPGISGPRAGGKELEENGLGVCLEKKGRSPFEPRQGPSADFAETPKGSG